MMGRSFKPSLSLRPRRPSKARTSSTSSTKSQDIPSPLSASFAATAVSDTLQQSIGRSSTPDNLRIPRSRPIAIELPSRRQSGQVSTPTPPEPLSARGDLLGGYFPLHEDFQRSYKTHPFHHENSSTKAGGDIGKIMPGSHSQAFTPLGHVVTETPKSSENTRLPPATDPLLMAMPLGKYHPSNYKNKSKTHDKLIASAAAIPNQQQHTRRKSDIKKKLQQYQRDMLEQAAIAGRMQIPGSKPISPRLIPLSSPGPVTPMELEESAGYLSVGANNAAHALNQTEMAEWMSMAMEEDDMSRYERAKSPAAGSSGKF